MKMQGKPKDTKKPPRVVSAGALTNAFILFLLLHNDGGIAFDDQLEGSFFFMGGFLGTVDKYPLLIIPPLALTVIVVPTGT